MGESSGVEFVFNKAGTMTGVKPSQPARPEEDDKTFEMKET